MYINKIINKIPPNKLFYIICISIIILTILIRSGYQTNILLSFIISGIVFIYLLLYENDIEDSENKKYKNDVKKLNIKMNKKFNRMFSNINNSVLYLNPNIVKIFINMIPFARFDTKNFKEALIQTNQLVRVYESAKLGQKLPNQTIDIAEELQRNILNHLQSIIHSFPSTVIADYRFQVQLSVLQKILQKIIDDIKNIYNKEYEKNGPNIYNPPPSIRSGPWKNPLSSKEYNKNWNFYY